MFAWIFKILAVITSIVTTAIVTVESVRRGLIVASTIFGIVKIIVIVLFFAILAIILYLLLISQWKDMARVLGYHGAEHKAIHALEHGAPLTPESVNSFSRLHPRCGTTFLFIVVLVSIVVFTFIGKPTRIQDHLLRVACMPLIAGVAFEFIRLTGKYQHIGWVKALSWPGMQFQLLTTREPDLSMCETAIAAINLVRDDATVRAMEAAGANASPEISFIQ